MSDSIYDQHLDRNAANYAALSPVAFVERSAEVFAGLPAVIHGKRRYTWAETRERSARLAAGLRALGVGRGTTVSVMLPNTPEMVEAHYAVPALGAVLNTLNTRLDAPLLAWQMAHCEARVLITDREFASTIGPALGRLKRERGHVPIVIDVCDSEYAGDGERLGAHEYEALLEAHAPLDRLEGPADEWDAIAVSYTSGTTGDPKGVVTHHRGAYLNAVCNAATWTMPQFPKYLWTLPMFHCNGWCFPWTVALLGGTHVCLRKVEAGAILDAMREHKVDHYCAAPIVHGLLVTRAGAARRHRAEGARHGRRRRAAGVDDRGHGAHRLRADPCLRPDRGLRPGGGVRAAPGLGQESISEQARLNGRQGVRYALQDGMTVLDPKTMQEVPADGETMGEIMFRGNIIMKGYLKNPAATDESFEGGWFHTGDLAVLEPDRYVKIKDRSKDIIISGGENISSLEVEDALYRHPAVLACAVVAQPDPNGARRRSPLSNCKPARGRRCGADRALPQRCSPATRCRARSASSRSRRLDRQDPEVRPARAGQVRASHRVKSMNNEEPFVSDAARCARRRHPDAEPPASFNALSKACSPRCRPSSRHWRATRRRASSSSPRRARPSAPGTT